MKYHSLTFLVIYILLPLVLKKIFKIPDLKSLSSESNVWTSSGTVSVKFFFRCLFVPCQWALISYAFLLLLKTGC